MDRTRGYEPWNEGSTPSGNTILDTYSKFTEKYIVGSSPILQSRKIFVDSLMG